MGNILVIDGGMGSRGGGWPSTKWVVTLWAASRGGEVEGGSERSLKEGGFCCQVGLLRFCTQGEQWSTSEQGKLTQTHQWLVPLDACRVVQHASPSLLPALTLPSVLKAPGGGEGLAC